MGAPPGWNGRPRDAAPMKDGGKLGFGVSFPSSQEFMKKSQNIFSSRGGRRNEDFWQKNSSKKERGLAHIKAK